MSCSLFPTEVRRRPFSASIGSILPRVADALACACVLALALATGAAGAPLLSTKQITAWPPEPADAVISYGASRLQNAELRMPGGAGPHPVVVVVHGGCWSAEYDRTYLGRMSVALARAGFAVWTPEFRRLGDVGGGWPGTFTDVADAIEKLRDIAAARSLDLSDVVLIGHSSGGQLALWYAGVARFGAGHPLHRKHPLAIRGVVALAPLADLFELGTACGDAGLELLGEKEFRATRRRDISPLEMLPLRVRLEIIQGEGDKIVPPAFSQKFVTAAKKAGDDARLILVPGGHFELIDPASTAWPQVLKAVRAAAGEPR